MYLPQLLVCLLTFQLAVALISKPIPTPSKVSPTSDDEEPRLASNELLDAVDIWEHSPVNRVNRRNTVLTCSRFNKVLLPGAYVIHSSNYDDTHTIPSQDYKNNTDCSYHLKASDELGGLDFECHHFQLEASDDCKADFLEMNSMDKFCGKTPPKQVNSKVLDMVFHTDDCITDKGFFCTVLSKVQGSGVGGLPCGNYGLDRGEHLLLTKNHPQNYDVLQYCKWNLHALNDKDQLQITCSSFDIMSYDTTCKWDWMKVDGQRYCGQNPPTIPPKVGSITVEYTTSNLVDNTRPGFNCTVSVTKL